MRPATFAASKSAACVRRICFKPHQQHFARTAALAVAGLDASLQPWAEQLAACGLAFAFACWLQRPHGWADNVLIEVFMATACATLHQQSMILTRLLSCRVLR